MSELANLLINSRHRVRGALASIADVDAEEASGFAYVKLAFAYRTLAICHLLLRADTRAFFSNLCRSAQTYLHLLMLVRGGRTCDPVFLCASRVFSFPDALAAGYLQCARELARLLPTVHDPRFEYEDDFLLIHCMSRMILAVPPQPAVLDAPLARWKAVLEGGVDPYRDAFLALRDNDAQALNDALERLIEARKRQFDEGRRNLSIDEETQITDGRLFIRGLALIRLSGMIGMELPHEYPMMPSLARLSIAHPPPTADLWRYPESE
ncbi:hypothetical protein F0U61_06175 [Archangium violaceum]|uniref:hypothetical protein n=1 Tax=Archangium violaceum TaxID=83451 RepID=UPI002B312129|nr:hypothetical protein F0U61_06175 [Archangium violaceum]